MYADGSIWSRLVRRMGTMGTVVLGLLLCCVVAPLAIPVLWLVDRIRTCPAVGVRTYLCMTAILGLELLGVVLAMGLTLLHWVGPLRDSERFQRANYRLQWLWGSWQLTSAMRLFHLKLETSGTELVRPGPVLVFIRHVSMPDTLLPPAVISLPHALRLRYVVKDALLYDPCLDLVGNNTPNAFVARGKDNAGDLAKIRWLCEGLRDGDGIVIYPEGTRFTPDKRARVIERFRKKGDETAVAYAESLKHVLPPRMGGALTLLEHAPSADVVFVGHVGLEAMGEFRDLWHGKLFGQTIELACWRVSRSDIPSGEADRRMWLQAEWLKMDRWVAERQETQV